MGSGGVDRRFLGKFRREEAVVGIREVVVVIERSGRFEMYCGD